MAAQLNDRPPFPPRDAHLHLPEHGEALSMVGLEDCAGVDECLTRISGAAAGAPAGAWLQARGARVQAWRERRFPTACELHDASGGRLVVVRSFDHHAIAVSDTVLSLSGINAATPDPAGGVIVRSGGPGSAPSGTLLESACGLVWRVMPEPTRAERTGFIRAALADLAQRGFVEVHDMFTQRWQVEILRELERTGDLSMRVRLYATREHFDGVQRCVEEAPMENVTLDGLKMFADGTLNSRTASMLWPFVEGMPEHPCGTPLLSFEQIVDGLRLARGAGVHAAIHAIGDRAVRTVLDAIESESDALPPHRIEHAQFIHPADVPRFASLGVIASMQPCHLLADVEAIQRFAPHAAERAFPLRSLVEAYRAAGMDPAAWVWLGSDTPVVPPDPLDNIQAAVHRRRRDADDRGEIGAVQAVGESLAWSLMRGA